MDCWDISRPHVTNVLEHPALVGGRVHPQLAWAKLGALAEGARLASRELWR